MRITQVHHAPSSLKKKNLFNLFLIFTQMAHLFSTLCFSCPTCKEPLSGSWEVLAPSEIYQLRCWDCQTVFNGLMIVCEQCDSDNFIMDSGPIARAEVACAKCGHVNVDE